MKNLFTILLTIIICVSLCIPTYAAEHVSEVNLQTTDNLIFIRAEQTRWYYREYNSIKQKRLWSITHGYWKTNWINC